MSVPNAQIRPYRPDDNKVVKLALGKAHTEGLAVANQRGVYPFFSSTSTIDRSKTSCASSIDFKHMGRVVVCHDRVLWLVARSCARFLALAVSPTRICMLGSSNLVFNRLVGPTLSVKICFLSVAVGSIVHTSRT